MENHENDLLHAFPFLRSRRAGLGRMETLGRCRVLDERRYLAESAMTILKGIPPPSDWLIKSLEEARTSAMQPRPLTAQQWRDKTREFMICAKPYFKAKADIYAFTMPKMILHSDGKIESTYEFTKEQQALLDQLDETIKYLQQLIYEKQP